jgi:CspA family cold shock protein
MDGTVREFDEAKGIGMIVGADDDSSFVFQCIEIADGTRDIDVGQAVSFRLLPRFGAFQAGAIEKR